jgi:hypothetical protein
MTIVSFRDAAVLSYLERHQHITQAEREKLVGTLAAPAKRIVKKASRLGMKSAPSKGLTLKRAAKGTTLKKVSPKKAAPKTSAA